mgnify:CR=1 FL=1
MGFPDEFHLKNRSQRPKKAFQKESEGQNEKRERGAESNVKVGY